jgi:mannose-1-phosphate guanylyltransferase
MTWAVVLAAGEGQRLSRLTRALYGNALPKQFARLEGHRSLLQATLERISVLMPPARTVVVVGEHHEELAREQLAEFDGIDLVLQPRNIGTGPGMLLPLARITACDPAASVAFFPSDHFVPHPRPLLEAVEGAILAASLMPGWLTVLGVSSEGIEGEYGWILPGTEIAPKKLPGLRRVVGFVEKPGHQAAVRFAAAGGLWNTFVCVGRAETVWSLTRRHLPAQTRLFKRYARAVGTSLESAVLRGIYSRMRPAHFSRDVLEQASCLSVLRVEGSGWCDFGSPRRVFHALRGTQALSALLDRLRVGAPRSEPERRASTWSAAE